MHFHFYPLFVEFVKQVRDGLVLVKFADFGGGWELSFGAPAMVV